MNDMQIPAVQNDLLASSIEWLGAHVDYERNGPGDTRSTVHDPEMRMSRMRRLLDLLDDPQRAFKTVHLTGTNGKTSTSRAVTRLLIAQGLRVGTYTSPHLQKVNERIAVDGESIGDEDLAEVLESIRLIETLIPQADTPSYFELITAAAFRHFADAPVDVGVVEVGVGGLYDATNVVSADVCVITNVGHDHHNYLGPTLQDIARHKAGIVEPGATVITGVRERDHLAEIEARRPGSMYVLDRDFEVVTNQMAVGGRLVTLRTPKATYDDVFVAAHGSHQGENAALATVAVEALFDSPLHIDVVRAAFENLTTPGRFEIIGNAPVFVLDGAHNQDGARRLVSTLDEVFGAPTVIVLGMLDPHQPSEMIEALNIAGGSHVVACRPDSPRAVPGADIAEAVRAAGAMVEEADSVAAAVETAIRIAGDDGVVLVTGSLYVVGEARSAITRSGVTATDYR